MASKAKKVQKKNGRRKLRTALVLDMKRKEQKRRGNKVAARPKGVTEEAIDVPFHMRAGYPLVKTKVNPKDWKTVAGKQVFVDLTRVTWLPDDWGQGVKLTNPISRSRPGFGGTYTVWVSPEGKVFYHQFAIEDFLGRKLSVREGFNGVKRTAKLQTRHTDEGAFFGLLSRKERGCLPKAGELHFCVISARRTQTAEGLKDIAKVQAQFEIAGVQPTWYVDEASLKEYQSLGLKAVVGGKLTAARNKALHDAARLGKACVQASDDIASWQYYEGDPPKERTDDAMNAAFAAATCHIVTPVTAARLLLAKLRACASGSPKSSPKLAGVYMLASCARAMATDLEVRSHFILGDFFVADKSPVRFDPEMKLKEDYDFTCQHIATHGSVIRCNRMTLNVKHYANSGGAVATRDKKGLEERRNIAILIRKWPRAIRMHPKRKNEVVLQWPSDGDAKAVKAEKAPKKAEKTGKGKTGIDKKLLKVAKKLLKRTGTKDSKENKASLEKALRKWKAQQAERGFKVPAAPPGWPTGCVPDPAANASWLPKGWQAARQVSCSGRVYPCYIGPGCRRLFHKGDIEKMIGRKLQARSDSMTPAQEREYPPDRVLEPGNCTSKLPYIRARCQAISGKTVRQALAGLFVKDTNGQKVHYKAKDLRWDLQHNFLRLKSK